MPNQDINELEANKSLRRFTFTLTCPKCHSPLTSQDFAQDHFTIAHLQDYFNQKETEYKSQLLAQIEKNAETSPLFKQIKEENEKLKLIVEGYKLGTTKNYDNVVSFGYGYQIEPVLFC